MVPEVDPSPSEVPLERLLWKGWIPTIFFEVLPKPRRVVELSPRLIVTLYNHKNEAIYREKLVASPGATVGQSLACTLLRHARMFGQQAVTPPSVEGTVPGSGVGRSSEGHSTNSCGQNALTSRQTPPSSSFGSHYLVLQVDPHECVIRKLFEMPVREDGTLDCDYPLGDMLSESPSTFNGGGVSTAVDPLVLSIVPAAPLPNDHFRLPCCHGEMFLEREGVPPATFGQPFVVTVSNSITVKSAQELLLEFTGLTPSDVLPLSRGVFVFPGRMCASLRLEESILDFMRRELRTMNPQIPSLLLNHRQSGEKHGLRYLAQSSPALRISKR
uniref:WGS project CAEQ00000000 data, annotated contig 184 n=1 Tax=Trypanosoma congolense (strain IL3000) TaxID=1068625 RepID=F9W9A5_TRYCI|nr:unnamed protein product [Trypanosoma congolense IL3000]